jgi:hypothetical protein
MRGQTVKRWILLGVAASALIGWAASTASARTLHFEVTVSVSGPGRVTGSGDGGSIDCPGTCSALIKQQTSITLTETPDSGAQFTSWGDECADSGSNDTCTLFISGPKSVTAGFGVIPPPPPKFTLTVTKSGTGTGYVGGAGGIDCGPACSVSLQEGSTIALLAVADDGSKFAGWGGGGCSGADKCTVTFTADTQVTATFDHIDRDPPHIRTIRASARRGTRAELRYRVFDDSGMSRELLTILAGKVTIARIAVPLATVRYGRIYSAHWLVPGSLKPGAHVYCAVAIDRAGNRSKRSCSSVTIT